MKPFACAVVSTLACTVVANPLGSDLRYSVNNRAITVTDAEVATFDFYAQYAGAGYCNSEVAVGSVVTCINDVCPNVTAAGATVTATFSGVVTDMQGFLSTDDTNQVIVLSLKGSTSIRNWIADLVFLQVGCDIVDGCLLHAGFATAWAEIEDEVLAAVEAAVAANPSYRIVSTGHSLGGAVATIAAAYIRAQGYTVDVITYGSPRVGNRAFVQFVTDQAGLEYRVTHLDDPVPRLPPILFNYRHTSPEYWFHTGDGTTVDYTAADAKVCEGTASLGCNAGTFGLDIDAHLHYFEAISACGDEGIDLRRRDVTFDMATKEPEDLTDEELLAAVNDFTTQDLAFVQTLEE